MDTLHRYDSIERQHYLFQNHYSFKLKPRLLYAGELKKSGGWRENAHKHDFCEIIFVSDGDGYVTLGDERRYLTRGDIVIYNPNTLHSEESSVDSPMELFFIALDRMAITDLEKNYLLPPNYNFVYHSGKYYDTFLSYFSRIITEFENKDEFYVEIAQNLSRTMLMYIFRIINEQTTDSVPLLKGNKSIDLAVKYINGNFKSDITLEDIANKCYVNKYYLSHQFTRHQGVSVGKYILSLRISEAMRLLKETQLSVNDVAEASGFNDISYFCRMFKKTVLLTPLQYRKREKDKNTNPT